MGKNQVLKQYFGHDSFRPGQEARPAPEATGLFTALKALHFRLAQKKLEKYGEAFLQAIADYEKKQV